MDWVVVQDADQMEQVFQGFLRRKERVLICLPEEPDSPGRLLCDLVSQCGGVPVSAQKDMRWISLLKQGFSKRCGCLVGSQDVILGLSKLAHRMRIPLYAHSCVIAGDPPDPWTAEAIQTGLDSTIRACFQSVCQSPEPDPVLEQLARELRRRTSILDFRLERTESGLSLEMVTFPGERLPKLPNLAKLVSREWDPATDCPFELERVGSNPIFSYGTH